MGCSCGKRIRAGDDLARREHRAGRAGNEQMQSDKSNRASADVAGGAASDCDTSARTIADGHTKLSIMNGLAQPGQALQSILIPNALASASVEQQRQIQSQYFITKKNKSNSNRRRRRNSSFLGMILHRARKIQSSDVQASQIVESSSNKAAIISGSQFSLNNDQNIEISRLQVPRFHRKRRKSDRSTSSSSSITAEEFGVNPAKKIASYQTVLMSPEASATLIEMQVRATKQETNQNESTNRDSDTTATLFTSIPSLCYHIISDNLLKKVHCDPSPSRGRVLCLFVFGRQGSSKGEVAFEIVQHSSLSSKILAQERDKEEKLDQDHTGCPLYHHIDASAIIIANIDARIREYNRLVAQTLRNRQQEQMNPSQSSSLDGSPAKDCQSVKSEDNNEDKAPERERERDQSISSDALSQNSVGLQSNSETVDEFGLITLSTKKRSILQLKLMKYFNSITSKWVMSLIQDEIDRMEFKFDQMISKNISTGSPVPDRIYLINLIPNQLNLFKSCLYLQQNVHLKGFKYSFWAIKFERRTNIKLMTKDRSTKEATTGKDSKSASGKNGALSGLRLSFLNGLNPSARLSPELGSENATKSDPRVVALADDLISGCTSEKLSPKFNDNFLQQFDDMQKLLSVRYNPIRDYNYAHQEDFIKTEKRSCSQLYAGHLMGPGWPIKSTPSIDALAEIHRSSVSTTTSTESYSNQLSPSTLRSDFGFSRAGSVASSAVTSGAESDRSGTSYDTPSPMTQSILDLPKPASQPGRGMHAIKCAIELSLYDSTSDEEQTQAIRQDPILSEASDEKQQMSPLTVYWNPKALSRASQRSPLMFASQSQRARACQASGYQLTPSRVVYANGRSQIVFEAKKVHPRAFRLRSREDSSRLVKLIAKVNRQLISDCDSWLFESIQSSHHQTGESSRRQSVGMDLSSVHPTTKPPSLIVYVVRVDISKLSGYNVPSPSIEMKGDPRRGDTTTIGRNQVSSTLVPILLLNEHDWSTLGDSPTSGLSPKRAQSVEPGGCGGSTQSLSGQNNDQSARLSSSLKSAAAQRPVSSRSLKTHLSRPKRHVQFQLSKAPCGDYSHAKDDPLGSLPARWRRWIGEAVFVSADRTKCDLLPLVATIFSSATEQQPL